jgi:hypothetical protein
LVVGVSLGFGYWLLVVALQRSRVMANSQHPIANELQIPNPNTLVFLIALRANAGQPDPRGLSSSLDVGCWDFIGNWLLVVGCYPRLLCRSSQYQESLSMIAEKILTSSSAS